MDANRVRGRKGSTPDAAFRTLWSPPIYIVSEIRSSHPTEKRWLLWPPCSEKRCAPQYTATREDETFMVCQLFSPYGETWAVLTSVFQTFSSLSAIRRNTDRFERVFPAIRRKTCCFDQVFSPKRFASLIYGHGKGENLTTFQKLSEERKNCLRKSCGSSRLSSWIVI